MNPCAKHQKALALLALNALESSQAAQLRAHLTECPGCRDYLDQLSAITQRLDAVGIPETVKTSNAFHSRVAAAVRAEASETSIVAQFFNWRIAVPALGMMAIVAVLVSSHRSSGPPEPALLATQGTVIPMSDLPPSLAVYRVAINESSDQFEKLLLRQANRALLSQQPVTGSSAAVLRNLVGSEE